MILSLAASVTYSITICIRYFGLLASEPQFPLGSCPRLIVVPFAFHFLCLASCFILIDITANSSAQGLVTTTKRSANPWIIWTHRCSTWVEAAYQRAGFSFLTTNPTATHRVISKTLSQHSHPQYKRAYGRILGFARRSLLARRARLTGVHFRLTHCFGSSFFQIPHWLVHFARTLSAEALSLT